MVTNYEALLDQDFHLALIEGSRYFERTSKVHQTLQKIVNALDQNRVEYAVIGDLAMFEYGYRRFTSVVELLVTPESFLRLHGTVVKPDFRPDFEGSRHLRDCVTGVKIVLRTEKDRYSTINSAPAALDDLHASRECYFQFKLLSLPDFISRILRNDEDHSSCLRVTSDVMELIKTLGLSGAWGMTLSNSVHESYFSIWDQFTQSACYLLYWDCLCLQHPMNSWDNLIDALPDRSSELIEFRLNGLGLDPARSKSTTDVWFKTADPALAKRFEMHDESEWMDGKTSN